MQLFKKAKILAPVGNFEMLASAIHAGGDEVYFGIGSLNMRVGARANFIKEDIPEIITRCQKSGIRTNLTLNIVAFDEELEEAYRTLDYAKKMGVDSVIAMDFGIITYSHKIGLETHASVQAGISNLESVRFYAQYCDRIVLARECSLDQQAYIVNGIQRQNIVGPRGRLVEIEVFAHGALCVSISGKCGMSLLSHNKSASRGMCLQPCRRTYEVVNVETNTKFEVDNQYVMSSGDIATIGMIDRLIEAGVDVLKIEGRGKNPEYVDMVVRTYQKAIQGVLEGTYTEKKVKEWRGDLSKVYNRRLTDGYYLGQSVKEWSGVSGSLATEKKLCVGKVTHVFDKAKVAQIKILSEEFSVGDELVVIGKKSGVHRFRPTQILDENGVFVRKASRNMMVTIPIEDGSIRKQDQVYIVVKTQTQKI